MAARTWLVICLLLSAAPALAAPCTGTCDDGNPCTDDTCNPQLGCVHTNNDANACSDGSACTSGDHCSTGLCVGSTITCPDDANPCTSASCNPASGCFQAFNTAACDDGNACTLSDTCHNGTCAGTPKNCSDGNVCTTDACNPTTGACSQSANTAPCDDGNACTSGDVCGGGVCQPGAAISCDDGNPCTDDTCGRAGCVHTPNDANACSDNSLCTSGDHCSSGVCVGNAVRCPDDANPCTTASCTPTTGCFQAFNTAACDDGDACTLSDTCSNGTCAGTPKTCTDDNPCTTDRCTSATGACTFTPNTAPCDDGNACTVGDGCGSGVCQPGLAKSCSDSNPCTTDTCDPRTGGCSSAPNTDACDDGDACTRGDVCGNGLCAGTAISCDDGDACTADACHAGVCGHLDVCDAGQPSDDAGFTGDAGSDAGAPTDAGAASDAGAPNDAGQGDALDAGSEDPEPHHGCNAGPGTPVLLALSAALALRRRRHHAPRGRG